MVLIAFYIYLFYFCVTWNFLKNHDVDPHIQNRLQEAAKMVEIPSPVLPAARPGAYNKRTMCEHNMILWGLTKHQKRWLNNQSIHVYVFVGLVV